MESRSKVLRFFSFISLVLLSLSLVSAPVQDSTKDYSKFDQLIGVAQANGTARVIVKLKVEKIKELTEASTRFSSPAPGLNAPWGGEIADIELRDAIAYATSGVLNQLEGTQYTVNRTYKSIPYLALTASADTLALLQYLPEVIDIQEDKALRNVLPEGRNPQESKGGIIPKVDKTKPMLNNTAGIVGATDAWGMGYTGSGWYVAVIDTGIRKTHEFFSGKTIVEACFNLGEDGATPAGDCPNGLTTMVGAGSAVHHASSYQGFDHGTHVSGIAAGNNGTLYGIAKDADIIAVQVFSKFATECGGPCVLSWNSDSAAGLDYVYSIRGSYSISSANMSLGGGGYDTYCDSDVRKAAIDNLVSAGIATCIATGNDGYCGYVGAPACVSTAVAVGSSDDADLESYFNNWHPTLQDLFAPGSAIYSSTGDSDSSYESWNGTSMATPHVAGAWALIKQAKPAGTVSEIKTALESTGIGVTSVCDGYIVPIPRIDIDDAITTLLPSGSITVTAPTAGRTYGIGSELPISWTSTGITGDVSIVLRNPAGTEKYTVTAATPYNNSPYNYTIPSLTPGTYLVRVKKDATIKDDSDNFTIGTINISSPTTGQTYAIGQQLPIQWTTQGITGDVSIMLRKSDGTEKYTVSAATAYNSSPINYTIPSLTPGSYLVRIKQDKLIQDSDVFTINASASSITVSTPNGGTFSTGDALSVAWSSSGITGDVRVSLRKSDGSIGYELEAATAYDSSPRVYNLPCDAPVGSYFIRVKQGTVKGESTAFTLNPSTYCISISNPIGGETYSVGNTIPIAWTTSGITGTVKIALRKADGSAGYEITAAAAYDGSPYNYVIPAGIPAGTYFIRVKQGALVKGESQNFNIN